MIKIIVNIFKNFMLAIIFFTIIFITMFFIYRHNLKSRINRLESVIWLKQTLKENKDVKKYFGDILDIDCFGYESNIDGECFYYSLDCKFKVKGAKKEGDIYLRMKSKKMPWEIDKMNFKIDKDFVKIK